jgi:hypothetical protein
MTAVALPVVLSAEGRNVLRGRNVSISRVVDGSRVSGEGGLGLGLGRRLSQSKFWLDGRQSLPRNNFFKSGQIIARPLHAPSRSPSLPHSLFFSSLVMSGQQCLRRLPAAMRSVPALRAGARAASRTPTARSYSAVSKANTSGLLSQASKRPGQLSSLRPWTLEQTRTYGA